MLGEDLVAFRDTNGQVGLIADNCPHRGAWLFFGRNEEAACAVSTTAGSSTQAAQVRGHAQRARRIELQGTRCKATAYPCRERGGIIWTYMGRVRSHPHLPDLEWNLVPASHAISQQARARCNWVQALEGGIDSSHTGFLHSLIEGKSRLRRDDRGNPAHRHADSKGMYYKMKDRHPHYESSTPTTAS